MADVFIPTPLRGLTDGQTVVNAPNAATVGDALELVERQFPGIRDRLVQNGILRAGLQVSVDGAIAASGLRHALSENSEVHFLPAIGGG